MTYEMKLLLPKPEVTELHDTIVQVKTVVDTVAVAMKRPKMPLAIYTLATIALHEDGPSYGLWFALMHRHGFFLHASTDLKSIGSTVGNCQEDGSINASGTKPYYTGATKHSNYTLTLGAIHTWAMASASSRHRLWQDFHRLGAEPKRGRRIYPQRWIIPQGHGSRSGRASLLWKIRGQCLSHHHRRQAVAGQHRYRHQNRKDQEEIT